MGEAAAVLMHGEPSTSRHACQAARRKPRMIWHPRLDTGDNAGVDSPLAKRLQLARGNRTQEDLAGQIGVPSTYLSRWENGRNRPALSRLPAISATYGIPMDELLSLLMDAPAPGRGRRVKVTEEEATGTPVDEVASALDGLADAAPANGGSPPPDGQQGSEDDQDQEPPRRRRQGRR